MFFINGGDLKVKTKKSTKKVREPEDALGHVQHVRISVSHLHKHTQKERRWNAQHRERPTNLKRGGSERVSWEEAEEKSTMTVTRLQRRDNGRQL